MLAQTRPPVAPLAEGYRLVSRQNLTDRPHHYIDRNGPNIEQRLRETSLYRPDLDLAVLDKAGEVVAYGLFWHDPTTGVGFVEPMGTNEGHRRQGLARHILTAGLDRLAMLGATRLKINYENDNPAPGRLYRDVGFTPTMTTLLYRQRQPAALAEPRGARPEPTHNGAFSVLSMRYCCADETHSDCPRSLRHCGPMADLLPTRSASGREQVALRQFRVSDAAPSPSPARIGRCPRHPMARHW
jgi:GNAT superfamily N-acetyltransferase